MPTEREGRLALADELDGLAELLTKADTGSDAGFDSICNRAAAVLRLSPVMEGMREAIAHTIEPECFIDLEREREWCTKYNKPLAEWAQGHIKRCDIALAKADAIITFILSAPHPQARGDYEQIKQSYRGMIARPSEATAGREAVIEECAQVCDGIERAAEARGNGLPSQSASQSAAYDKAAAANTCARAIRALPASRNGVDTDGADRT